MREIFGTKRDEVRNAKRKLHIEELPSLYSAPCIIRTIKSKKARLQGYITGIEESFLPSFRNRSQGKRQLERLRFEGR
jgi:hypothetical protein